MQCVVNVQVVVLVVGPNRLWDSYVAPISLRLGDVLDTFDPSTTEVGKKQTAFFSSFHSHKCWVRLHVCVCACSVGILGLHCALGLFRHNLALAHVATRFGTDSLDDVLHSLHLVVGFFKGTY